MNDKTCRECGKPMTLIDTYRLMPNYPGQDRYMKVYKCLDKECTGYGNRCPIEVNT